MAKNRLDSSPSFFLKEGMEAQALKRDVVLEERTVSFVSLGCPKNLVDTESMIRSLEEQGFRVVPETGEAEVIVVNTCSFVTDARRESVDTLLEMSRLKEEGKAKLLI